MDISKKLANEHYAHLLANIDQASKALSLFSLLREEFVFKKQNSDASSAGVLQVKRGNLMEDIVLSYIVIKIHIIFDKSRYALSVKRFLDKEAQYITGRENIERIKKLFHEIEGKYKLLIEKIKNNRNYEIAHLAKNSPLGVIEEVAEKIRDFGRQTDNKEYIEQKSVEPNMERFSVGNFPIKEAENLVKALSKIIFAIRYPKRLDNEFKI